MKKKYGNIAIIGKPNVGKSTLINAITNTKSSIISNKPQTTRNAIKEIYEDEEVALILVDTPGFHNPKNKLDLFLNEEVVNSYKNANVIFFLTSMDKPLNEDDYEIIKVIKEFKKDNIILVISKAELSKNQDIIDKRIDDLRKEINFVDVIQISALHQINIKKLIDSTKPFLKEDVVSDYFREQANKSDEFVVAEKIREQCLNLLSYEVPHGVGIEINESNYDPQKNLWKINASIVLERESHKKIVIGKGGEMIKKIGLGARKNLEEEYNCKIFLAIFVKIETNWRDNQNVVKSLGYKSKK